MDKKLNEYAILMFIALSIYLLVGVIYSPPLEPLRVLLGIRDLPATRMTNEGYKLIPDNYELFHLRTVHYYHGLFIGLISVSVILYYAITRRKPDLVLEIILFGGLITMASAIIYGYITQTPIFHGLFIFGLSVVFTGGLFILIKYSRTALRTNSLLVASTLMLLIGGILGAVLGSYYMDPQASQEYISAVISSRIDPDLAEDNILWRMRAGHEHGMLLSALGLAAALLIQKLNLSYNKATRRLVDISSISLAIASISSYLLVVFGGVVHKVITPASLLVITALGLLGLYNAWRKRGFYNITFTMGIILVWLFVAIPGALIAASLREPTSIINPAFRDPAWDYVELAYNIGHWHLLLMFWGVAILITASTIWPAEKTGKTITLLSLIGLILVGAGFNLYILTNGPNPTNPYNNLWIRTLIEPGLTLTTLATIMLGISIIKPIINKNKSNPTKS